MRKNQKVLRDYDNELVLKNYPKNKQIIIQHNQNLNHQIVLNVNEIIG